MVKECSSKYKKVKKRWLFKDPLTEWFFVEPKMVLLLHRCEEPFEAPLFLRVCDTALPTWPLLITAFLSALLSLGRYISHRFLLVLNQI